MDRSLEVVRVKIGENYLVPKDVNAKSVSVDVKDIDILNVFFKDNLVLSDQNRLHLIVEKDLPEVGDQVYLVPAHLKVKLERVKQKSKHGFTEQFAIENEMYYDKDQLLVAANRLTSDDDYINGFGLRVPENWDLKRWEHLCNHPYEERLIIAASFICAHHDYLKYKQFKSKQ